MKGWDHGSTAPNLSLPLPSPYATLPLGKSAATLEQMMQFKILLNLECPKPVLHTPRQSPLYTPSIVLQCRMVPCLAPGGVQRCVVHSTLSLYKFISQDVCFCVCLNKDNKDNHDKDDHDKDDQNKDNYDYNEYDKEKHNK